MAYAPPPGYPEQPQYAVPPGYPPYAYAPAPADPASELASLKAENTALKMENAALKAENAALKSGSAPPSVQPALVPPPNLAWPPPYGAPPGYPGYAPPGYGTPPSYGAPPGYGAPPPAYGAPPPLVNKPLPMNAENKRGPKGANLAVFCIPNNYTDQNVLDLCTSSGTVIFCQVAVHRETGQSRGYAFVSYETVEMANAAIANLHNMTVEGRTLRVELARADKEAKPY